MLDVTGTVEIDLGGDGRGRFVGEGDRLLLEVDDPAALASLAGRRELRRLGSALARAGLTLHVRSGERRLLITGAGVRAGLVGRVLRLPHARLAGRFALLAVLPRRKGTP